MRIDNLEEVFKAKIVAQLSFMEKILTALNTLSSHINIHYGFFDECACFIIRFQEYVDIGLFTNICFQMIRKNSQRKNEDLLFLYRVMF